MANLLNPPIISRQDAKAKGLIRYFTGKPCKHGHVAERFVCDRGCARCKEVSGLRYMQTERGQTIRKSYNDAYQPGYRQSERGSEVRRDSRKSWRGSEHGRQVCNALSKKYYQERMCEAGSWKVLHSYRARLVGALKKQNLKKSEKTFDLTGCSYKELIEYLESKFLPGMTWANHGQGPGKWQVDHIKPCGSFDLSASEQRFECFHFSNLQPLWEEDHRVKSVADIREMVNG